MRIIGCDLHARQQTIAMLDTDTGELEEKTLEHEGETVREFYSALRGPILVGIEATGSMQWFLELMEELGIECRVGHPAKIRKAETRKQKHDRRDARLLLTLLAENRFPTIWMTSRAISFTASLGVQCSPASSLFSSLKRRTSASKIVPIPYTCCSRLRGAKVEGLISY